ncbi:probable 6-phosphogluconolactonase 1 isoform X2 [Olea europaea var. sylvestris]|uniref:probable 6-phosphogluconolactonase 1 isoform X2 n=1 Tax=Olea europaea var. sylvestris TaxID=158386 RepID=UPI000C1CD83E|nr:probable 6-phosphogluconolactonase 1 isoform X2 [Olea europaea var. sylvestris]
MALSRDKKDGRELRIHENMDELSTNLAEYIAELSEASVKERGAFAIALSGGSVISLVRKLCEAPFNKTVEWAKWHIFWADERVVAKSHVDSNYKLLKDNLLTKVPTVPGHVHSINDTVTAEQAAEEYEFVIRQHVRTRVIDVCEINDCPKFDLILLGMGHDGHIASLFPNHSALDEKELWVAAKQRLPTWLLMISGPIVQYYRREWCAQLKACWCGFLIKQLHRNSMVQ